MNGTSICETCGKEYKWRKSKSQKPPRFCSRKCRVYEAPKVNPNCKNSDLTNEEQFEKLKIYFEKHVIKKEGCWDWSGSLDFFGYTKICLKPPIGQHKGHRLSYRIYKGEIPTGKLVCHSCDNRKCTNPEHLWIGTSKENTQDKIIKGRSNIPKGSQLKAAKLNEDQVRQIKVFLDEGSSCYRLGKDYDVSSTSIQRIRDGISWKHVVENKDQ